MCIILDYIIKDEGVLTSIMSKAQLSIVTVFLPFIWSPMIPIHYIPLENIIWINWTDPQGMYSLHTRLSRIGKW